MNPEEAIELTKKISGARTDIEKLNKAITDHPYGNSSVIYIITLQPTQTIALLYYHLKQLEI